MAPNTNKDPADNKDSADNKRHQQPTAQGADIEQLKAQFLNLQFDTKDFVLDAQKLQIAAQMSGATQPRFCDPTDPDFQALPGYIASLAAGRHLPVDFPRLGGIPMDGGKAVTCHAPVRAGIKLTGNTHLHDIYDKQGRSGRMLFLVSRMEIFDEAGTHLASSDSRMVVREKHTDKTTAKGAKDQ